MKHAQRNIVVETNGQGLYDATPEIDSWISRQTVSQGLLTVFLRHTSASLIIQENADPDVLRDLADYFAAAVPEDPARYRHQSEGPDDMPAHIKNALTATQLSIPVNGGRMLLGVWQAVYLFEHRHAPHRREIVLHLIGE